MKRLGMVPTTLLVTAAAGCSSSQDDAICRGFATGSGAVIASSPGVTVDNENRAFDGDLSTASQMYAVTGSGSASFEASGNAISTAYAGVLLGLPAAQITQVSISALRNGTVVSSGTAGTQSDTSQACPGICQSRDGRTFFGISVEGVFDTIQAAIQISGTTADTLVYELCTRGS